MNINLTRDELLVFLSLLGAKTMNGLGDDPFANLNDLEIVERLNSGEHSLISRGLLSIDENTATLDETLMTLVGSSVFPDATLLISRSEPDGSNEVHYFNATSKVLVEQTSPRPGIHTFAQLPDSEAFDIQLEMLLASLTAAKTDAEHENLSGGFTIAADEMTQIVAYCQQGEKAPVYQILIQAGWPEDVASKFAQHCTTFPTWVGVVAWNLRDEEPQALDPVMIFLGDDHCWLAENVENAQEKLHLQMITAAQGAEKLMALAEPLKKNYLQV